MIHVLLTVRASQALETFNYGKAMWQLLLVMVFLSPTLVQQAKPEPEVDQRGSSRPQPDCSLKHILRVYVGF